MTEREKLVEIMAKAADPIAWSTDSNVGRWLRMMLGRRRTALEHARAGIEKAEAAGWTFVAPDDGR